MANCTSCKKDFIIREKDKDFYSKFDVPEPTMCPECRLQNKLCFRNERTLYKRKSDLSDKDIVSIYHQDSPFKVYSSEEWWSDKHEGLQYGRDFDFSRPFFEQFRELQLQVPRIALFNINPTNSDFCQQAYNNKNCYLCVVVEDCEDSMYMTHSNKIRTSYDSSYLQDCELCYDCIDSTKLYNCIGCQSCQNSSDLMFCYDCVGCQNCVGCFGIRNKKYWIMNKQYTKEQYDEKIKLLEFNKHSKFVNARDYFLDWTKNLPHRSNRNFNVENCTGNYLINAKDSFHCFNSFEIQDCAYCTWIFHSRDCFDVYGLGYGELVYEGLGVERLNACAFNTFVSHSNDTFYSDLSFNSHYLFGCVGLKSKKYCILNKEYSPDEYKELKAKIVEHMEKNGEWGRFFPKEFSPFAYNETAANDHFPLSKGEAANAGFQWREKEKKEYLPASAEIPDDVNEAEDSICKETFACAECEKNYKTQVAELGFYKKWGIAIPRKCPDCRYAYRLSLRNPRILWKRKCEKCGTELETTYATNRSEKVYCEKCYTEEVK